MNISAQLLPLPVADLQMVYYPTKEQRFLEFQDNIINSKRSQPLQQEHDYYCDDSNLYECCSDANEVSRTFPLLCNDNDSGSASSLSSLDSTDSLSFGVSWAPQVVREVHYRPRLSDCEKRQLFYKCSDYHRFRQTYKDQLLKAGMERRKNAKQMKNKERAEEEDILHNTTPLTWIVNKVHNYFTASASKPSSQPRGKAVESRSISTNKDLHLELLIDTLYLF